MRVKVLSLMLILMFTVILTGCIGGNDPYVPAVFEGDIFDEPTFTPVPTYFTRTTDGARLELGMHRDEIEEFMDFPADLAHLLQYAIHGIYVDSEGRNITVYYDSYISYSIITHSPEWIIASAPSMRVGEEARLVIESGKFEHLIHNVDTGNITISDVPPPPRSGGRTPTHALMISYNEYGIIEYIAIAYFPTFAANRL